MEISNLESLWDQEPKNQCLDWTRHTQHNLNFNILFWYIFVVVKGMRKSVWSHLQRGPTHLSSKYESETHYLSWDIGICVKCHFRKRTTVIVREYKEKFSKSGNKFLTKKFLYRYISEGVYYHCTKDLFATPEGKPMAASGSSGKYCEITCKRSN